MIDPTLERQAADTKELLALWQTYHEFFNIGKNNDNITPEKEDQFLRLKSRIAELHDSLMDALDNERKNIGQGVLDIISRSITLKHLGKLSTADVKKMEIEWHECYLLVNDTIGALDDKRAEIAPISASQYKAKRAGAAAGQKVTSFFTSGGFKLAVILGVILFATVGVQMLGIFDWNKIGTIPALQTPYRWGKAIVRKTVNPDSPWAAIIDPAIRKAYTSWPSGIKPPEVRSDTKDDVIKRLPPTIGDTLKPAAEYRKETTSAENQGGAEIHTFLFNDTSQAKTVMDTYEKQRSTPQWKGTYDAKFRFVRNVNIITMLYSENGGFVNSLYVGVYEGTD